MNYDEGCGFLGYDLRNSSVSFLALGMLSKVNVKFARFFWGFYHSTLMSL